jgi:hypothetical protein
LVGSFPEGLVKHTDSGHGVNITMHFIMKFSLWTFQWNFSGLRRRNLVGGSEEDKDSNVERAVWAVSTAIIAAQ